jgi:hypothetical protein
MYPALGINDGWIPGQCGGVKAGHWLRAGDEKQGAPRGLLLLVVDLLGSSVGDLARVRVDNVGGLVLLGPLRRSVDDRLTASAGSCRRSWSGC